MMNKKNILVSGASGIVGYGILRSLAINKEKYRLIGTSIYEDSVAPAFCDIFELALPTNHNGYLDWLCDVIKKHSIDMVIPGIEADMFFWNECREIIICAGASPMLNSYDLINLCRDKWNFYRDLVEVIPEYLIPTTDQVGSNIYGFPYILKPKRGYGSQGVLRINNADDYCELKEKIKSGLIMQPLIGSNDAEYTVSAFFEKEHNLIDYLPFKRKLSLGGYTESASVVDIDFGEILQKIGSSVKPIGPTNFQFRFDEKLGMRLLEINPRISSATSIRASLGYNESQMSVDYFLDGIMPVKINKESIKNRRVVRYMEDYIF